MNIQYKEFSYNSSISTVFNSFVSKKIQLILEVTLFFHFSDILMERKC